jgi:hypothetical protein
MMKKNRRLVSLRWKLLLPFLSASLGIMAYINFVWIPQYLQAQKVEYLGELNHHLDSVIEGLIPLMLSNQVDIINENLRELKRKNQNWDSVLLTNVRGKQIYPPMIGSALVIANKPGLLMLEKDIGYFGQSVGHLTVQVDLTHWMEKRIHLDGDGGGHCCPAYATLGACGECASPAPVRCAAPGKLKG